MHRERFEAPRVRTADGRRRRQTDARSRERASEGTNERTNERTRENRERAFVEDERGRRRERTNERTNVRTNERTNERARGERDLTTRGGSGAALREDVGRDERDVGQRIVVGGVGVSAGTIARSQVYGGGDEAERDRAPRGQEREGTLGDERAVRVSEGMQVQEVRRLR